LRLLTITLFYYILNRIERSYGLIMIHSGCR